MRGQAYGLPSRRHIDRLYIERCGGEPFRLTTRSINRSSTLFKHEDPSMANLVAQPNDETVEKSVVTANSNP